MPLQQMSDFTFKHSEQQNKLYKTMTAEEIKAAFDSRGDELRAFINGLVQILQSTTDGDSGADNIGATEISALGSANTVQAILEALVNALRATTDSASGADFVKATAINGLTGDNVQALLEALKAYIDTHKTSSDHDSRYFTESELQSTTDNNAGADKIGATSITGLTGNTVQALLESLKGLVDAVQSAANSHAGNTDNPHSVTAAQVGAYSKSELQTSGAAQVHWDNLINIPPMADDSWKPPVATANDLPSSGNEDGDLRIVLDEDTVYTWDGATSSWKVIGASGSGISDHGTLKGLADDDHTQYLRHDGGRAMTGNLNMAQHQIQNAVVHKGVSFPGAPVDGQLFFNTAENKLYIYKTSGGWTDISGQGAVIRKKEIVATAGQTVFDLSDTGTYEVGANVLSVYKKNAEGKYELVDSDEYIETDSTTVTLATGANAGDEYLFVWFENTPTALAVFEPDTATATDTTPFHLPSSIKKSNMAYALYGMTGHNIIKNGNFADGTNGWTVNGTWTIDTTTYAVSEQSAKTPSTGEFQYLYQLLDVVPGHKYFVCGYGKAEIATDANNRFGWKDGAVWGNYPVLIGEGDINSTTWVKRYGIITPTQSQIHIGYSVRPNNCGTFWAGGVFALDLTALGLEDKTADEINAMFPVWFDGTAHVQPSLVRATGKNLLPPFTNSVWELSSNVRIISDNKVEFTTTGADWYAVDAYIPIEPNKEYKFMCNGYGRLTLATNDTLKNTITTIYSVGTVTTYDNKVITFTSDTNAKYLRIKFSTHKEGNYYFEPLFLSTDTTLTEYEPYTETTASIPYTLRRLPNGVYDEVTSDGQYVQRIKEYVLQSGDITALDTTSYANADIVKFNKPAEYSGYDIWESKSDRRYIFGTYGYAENATVDDESNHNKVASWAAKLQFWLIVPKGTYPDLAAAQADLAGTTLIYQLATPITTDISPQPLVAHPNGLVYAEGDIPPEIEWEAAENVAAVADKNVEAVRDISKALHTKADTGHTHDDRYYTESEADTFFMQKSGGTFTGIVTAYNNTSYTTKQVRNIFLSTADPQSTDGDNGDIWIKYK